MTMITLYGEHADAPTEIAFGDHGFKKILRRGKVVRIIGADGTLFRVGMRIKLVRRHGSERTSGLADIPLKTEGRVVGLDPRGRWIAVLRVRFPGHRNETALSVRPDEVAPCT